MRAQNKNKNNKNKCNSLKKNELKNVYNIQIST
jgi:hypothetical protein